MVIQKITNSDLLIFGTLLFIILASVFLALSPLMEQYPDLAIGITYDLTLTAPLLYFLFIRKKKIPKITIVPLFILGVILATMLLPEDRHYHLDLVKTYALPGIELAVLSMIFYKVGKTIKAFKKNSRKIDDFYLVFKESAIEVLGNSKFCKFITTEIAMIYYGLFSWKRKTLSENQFTNYKDNGTMPLLWAFIFIVLVETTVFHILLQSCPK